MAIRIDDRSRSRARRVVAVMSRPIAVAVGFGAVAVGFVGWYFIGSSSTAKTWIPNVATAAAGIALTVSLVQWIVRREEARRRAPRVDRALAHIQGEWVTFVQAVGLDHLLTHSDPKPLPRDALEVVELWLAEQDTADLPHPGGLTARDGTLRDAGLEFIDQVDQYDARDRDVLEADLVAAIRDLYGAGRAAQFWLHRKTPAGMPDEVAAMADPQRRSYRALVAGALAFGRMFRCYAAPVVFAVDPEVREWAEMLRGDEAIACDLRDDPGDLE